MPQSHTVSALPLGQVASALLVPWKFRMGPPSVATKAAANWFTSWMPVPAVA